ncbi:MAG: 2Fe-2S iron-sulfur cluster binding domain-containing protein [Aquificae bacterium]|nr:2Fe-2S iron-sulfur cluster binding domain-containing protein [Aquificota bacterium]
MEKVTVTIDGKQVKVPSGITVLEAAKKLNILIPTFCYHEKLPIFGGCRMCLVWDVNAKRSIIACGTQVYDGMEIETLNDEVLKDRKFILEMLFTRHPLDCPVCDKSGECDLQNWGTYYGPQHNILPISPFEKVRPEEDWESDYLEFVSNRCVLCLKCTSVCDNINKSHTLYQEERGFEIVIAPDKKPMNTKSSCEMCGLCVDVCPVGAIVFKPFKYKARPWLLEEKVTYCGMCSLQCPVAIDHDSQNIYRIRSTADLMVCSGAYLGYDIFDSNRLYNGLINLRPVERKEALDKVASIINQNSQKTAIVLSPWSLNESFEAIKELIEKTGIIPTSTVTLDTLPILAGITQEIGEYTLPSQLDIEKAKKIVVIGDDIANTHPVISYLFGSIYELGKPVKPNRKEVIFIGEKIDRLKKYYPREILVKTPKELLKLLKTEDIFDEDTVVLYSSSYTKGNIAYELGKALGRIQKEKSSKIVILPIERNAFGLINNIKSLAYLLDVLNQIQEGKIENLIIFGEDLLEHFDQDYLKEIFLHLKNLVVFTPFDDGIALSANIAVGIPLWFEEEGTTEGFRGRKPIKKAINYPQEEKEMIKQLTDIAEYQPKAIREEVKIKEFYDSQFFEKKEIKIWDFGYFTYRSKNLMNWKLKNTQNNTYEVISDE